jgi:hypothetical protein
LPGDDPRQVVRITLKVDERDALALPAGWCWREVPNVSR